LNNDFDLIHQILSRTLPQPVVQQILMAMQQQGQPQQETFSIVPGPEPSIPNATAFPTQQIPSQVGGSMPSHPQTHVQRPSAGPAPQEFNQGGPTRIPISSAGGPKGRSMDTGSNGDKQPRRSVSGRSGRIEGFEYRPR
jgi:hypothetical protein